VEQAQDEEEELVEALAAPAEEAAG